jgi:tetratricopeptide (TPR) repeat protein
MALAEALAAVKAAASVGHQRAELNATLLAVVSSFTLGQRDQCHEHIGHAQELVRRLGALRFEQTCLITLGRLALAEGHRSEAINLLHQAVALSENLGRSFHGAHILGALATALEEPEPRRRALSNAEALIEAGCFAHNQLRFYPDAMNVALDLGDLETRWSAMRKPLKTLPSPNRSPGPISSSREDEHLQALARRRGDPTLPREILRTTTGLMKAAIPRVALLAVAKSVATTNLAGAKAKASVGRVEVG